MTHHSKRSAASAWPTFSLCVLLLFGALSAIFPGCGEESGRQAAAGTVTFDGAPLADGSILFRPQSGGQNAGAKIEQGEFQVPRDRGLLPGEYRIEIKAMRAVGKTYIDSESGREEQDREQFIPAKYNARTQLAIEVTAGGDNRFDFTLTSSKD